MKRKFVFLLCINAFIFSGVDLQKRKDAMIEFDINETNHSNMIENYSVCEEILAERDLENAPKVNPNAYLAIQISMKIIDRIKELYDFLIANQNVDSEVSDERFIELVKKYNVNYDMLKQLRIIYIVKCLDSTTEELIAKFDPEGCYGV